MQGRQTFFGERAKILKVEFSQLMPCRYMNCGKSGAADVKIFFGLHPILDGKQ